MSVWDKLRMRQPRFVAIVDILTKSLNAWNEECPDEECWHFVTKDKRFKATVYWRFYSVEIRRVRI